MRHKAIVAVVALAVLAPLFAAQGAAAELDPPVSIYQDATRYALYNGHITATISKISGEIYSLRCEGRELLAETDQRAPGSWFSGMSGVVTDRIVIDPAGNHGDRGEVSIRGNGPVVNDIRYSLGRGDRGLHAWQILSHSVNAPGGRVSSGGFQLRLDPTLFDSLTIGKGRTHAIPAMKDWIAGTVILSPEGRRMTSGEFAGKLICGWDDAAMQMETPVYGYSGAKAGVGVWIINPSCEYQSRGGNVIEPTGWLDSVDGAPTLMNRWGGEPGAGISLERGESWSHVFGPFVIYCNGGSFGEADGEGKVEKKAWPFAWAGDSGAGARENRASISGRIILNQSPLANSVYANSPPVGQQASSPWQNPNVQAEAIAPTTQPQTISELRKGMVGLSSDADWQTNFFDDQYWVRAGDDGTFSISGVRPGTYTLHVYSEGQIGEASLGGIRLEAGQKVDLGNVGWKPQNYGQFVWQLGYPDRSAAKFGRGEDATRWGDWILKPKEFPAVVNYVVGKSDPKKDWNFAQYPGSEWTVHFSLGFVPRFGGGFLYVTLAGGSGAARLRVILNGKDISGSVTLPDPPMGRAAGAVVVDDIAHDQVRGFYRESVYSFGPSDVLLGDNALVLRVDGRKPTDGLMYDCLRMEMRADSTDPYGTDPENGNLPVYLPGNTQLTPGFRLKEVYKGDPSGQYGLNGTGR